MIVFGVTTLIFAWSNPTAPPPGGTLSAPLNTGSTAQTKTGSLTIATSTYLATTGGSVGIGTTGPSELLHLLSSTAAKPVLRIENTNADNNPGLIHFVKDSVSPAADDLLGQLSFYGDDSGGTSTRFATIFVRSADVTDTSEDGSIHFKHLVAGTDTEVMTLASGNVGIGTTGPGGKLEVSAGAAPTAGVKISADTNNLVFANAVGTTKWYEYLSGNDLRFWDTADRITIQSGGNVGIGTAGPEGKLSVTGDVGIGAVANTDQASHMLDIASTKGNAGFSAIRALYPGGGGLAGTEFGALAHRGGAWTAVYGKQGSGSSAAYFDGNVGIGTVGPGYLLTVNSSTPGCNGCTAWTNYSDIRLKDNVAGLSGDILDKIMELKPVTFNYNDTYYSQTGYTRPDGTTPTFTGFIAQDLQQIFPEMVNTASSGYLDTNLSNLQIYLVKGMQEQQGEITSLSAQIGNLTLSDSGDLNITTTDFGNYQVTAADETVIDRIGAFGELVAAHVKTGLVETKELVVEGSVNVASNIRAGLIETKKLMVDGVDLLQEMKELKAENNALRVRIEALESKLK